MWSVGMVGGQSAKEGGMCVDRQSTKLAFGPD